MFHKGQHVACIAEIPQFKDVRAGVRYPVKGVVYTVRQVCEGVCRPGKTLLLEEIVNPEINYRYQGVPLGRLERRFYAERFRPLVKLTVEQFTATLAPITEDA